MYFGCIADDFTGAADAASFLEKGGMKVALVNGVPNENGLRFSLSEVDAVVIALKSRGEEPEQAVRESIMAAQWLKSAGAEQYYIKYCSTFDSTKKGNIGPVCDKMLQWAGQKYTVLCPSLPSNQRTVKKGILYVDGVLLEHSPLRLHPLNPMVKSRIKDLMEPQSEYPCMEVSRLDLLRDDFKEELQNACQKQEHFYLIPDYETEADGALITANFGRLPVLTGGSGLCEELAKFYVREKPYSSKVKISGLENNNTYNALILSGSCSPATRKQIEEYQKKGMESCKINPEELLEDFSVLEHIKKRMKQMQGNLLIYSANLQEKSMAVSRHTQSEKSRILDQAFAQLAQHAIDSGIKHLIVAGGETSGAVVKQLGYHCFYVGKSIAPGVPVLTPTCEKDVRLVLKSGNFGGEGFFTKAIKEMG